MTEDSSGQKETTDMDAEELKKFNAQWNELWKPTITKEHVQNVKEDQKIK